MDTELFLCLLVSILSVATIFSSLVLIVTKGYVAFCTTISLSIMTVFMSISLLVYTAVH